MAKRRMFTQEIVFSDAFLDMPPTAQNLYFHLGMNADDDGFVNNPKSIARNVRASEDDTKLLIVKKFVICFEDGVVVIKHWKMHNYIQADRYKPTKYKDHKEKLLLNSDGVYSLKEAESGMYPFCIQTGRVGKVRLGEVSQGEVSLEVSKKESNIKSINNSHTCAGARVYERESYEEIMVRLGLSDRVRVYFFKFIQFQQANKKIVTNDMLEKTIRCIQGAAERRIRKNIPGGFVAQLNADLSGCQEDIDTYICEAIQQALNGQWFELKEPKEFKTAAEWEEQAEEDMKLWGLK